MASSKPSLPSSQVFSSDPLEQIYAQQLPSLDGLAYMFLNNARGRREEGAASYMQGVDRANRMSMMLGQLEEQAKLREAQIKGTVDLVGKGYNPSTMTGGGALFNDIPGGDAVAKLFQNKMIADANQSNAAASHAGDAGVTKIQEQTDYIPGAAQGVKRVTVTGRNAEQVSSISNARGKQVLAELQRQPRLTPEQERLRQQLQAREQGQ